MGIPRLETYGNAKQLLVHNEPFIMVAGEVHNSNASSAEYMEAIWDKAEELGMNSLLLPVSWENIEPEEGSFDFELVDQLIMQARERNKKIGVLWFGTWKNAQCMYAPGWVKQDTRKFWRGQIIKGKNKAVMPIGLKEPYTTLSYLCEETMKADARAFARLMAHIRDIDGSEQTVIIVQVENETGLLGSARERSEEADRRFQGDVPAAFASEIAGKEGNWEHVFGEYAEEAFSAYYISKYVGYVAAAGKKEYPLPMTVNAWQDKPGEEAGEYPSGGPVTKNLKIWRWNAPAIDIFAPDIYVPDFCRVCDQYAADGNPLFIPECATHSMASKRMIYTIGKYHAVCYSPFGFEEMGESFNALQGMLFGMDTDDPALQVPQPVAQYRDYAERLKMLIPQISTAYGTERLQAAISENPEETCLHFEKTDVRIIFEHPFLQGNHGVCLVLQQAPYEYFLLADECGIEFVSREEDAPYVDYLLVEEGIFVDGHWKVLRRLNGDETQFLKLDRITLLHIRILQYE